MAAVVVGSLALAPASGAQPAQPFPSSLPSISGSPVPGQTLTCSSGTWLFSPTQYAFSWQRDLTTQIGTGSQYTVASNDVGHALTCQVVATNDLGSTTATSLPVVPSPLPPVGAPLNTSPPGISGNPTPGQTLTCSTGSWANSPTTYAYSWQSNGSNIPGQTSGQYLVQDGDVGSAITCMVVASNGAGPGPPAISVPVIVLSGGSSGGGGAGGAGGSGSVNPGGFFGGSGGGGAGAVATANAPKLKTLSVSPRRVPVVVRGKRRSSKGTSIRYSIDRTASVLMYVQQKRRGRWVTVRVIAVLNARAGLHSVRYNARQGKKLLPAGSCRVIAAATSRGAWSTARRASFSVFKKKVKQHKPKHHGH